MKTIGLQFRIMDREWTGTLSKDEFSSIVQGIPIPNNAVIVASVFANDSRKMKEGKFKDTCGELSKRHLLRELKDTWPEPCCGTMFICLMSGFFGKVLSISAQSVCDLSRPLLRLFIECSCVMDAAFSISFRKCLLRADTGIRKTSRTVH